MYDYLFILPNQLFEIPDIVKYKNLIFVEHPNYFTLYSFHINKLILHRASMKCMANAAKPINVIYIECANYHLKIQEIFRKYNNFALFDPIDHPIYKEFAKNAKHANKTLTLLENPNFICGCEDIIEYAKLYPNISHKSFYIHFRKKYQILIESGDKPVGGKWSFDKVNRLKFPNKFVETSTSITYTKEEKKYIKEATEYAKTLLSSDAAAYADQVEPFYLPITHKSAKKYFADFITNKLNDFGPYEDAMRSDVSFGFHSVISPILNIGLLDITYIVETVCSWCKVYRIESIEGYIRQLFWREYCRFIYMNQLNKLIKETPFFDNKRKLNVSWFKCSTKTQMPNIDNCLSKFIKYGYLHHIERLMCIGNFMLITDIDRRDVFEWFMMFIDAYPWVMYPNVYGMSQYVPGNLMVKRPYFSSSNYIIKMSDWTKSSHGSAQIIINNKIIIKPFEIWDALYYRFIDKNKNKLAKNYATASAVAVWKAKPNNEKNQLLYVANWYLKKYL